ncbi:MAG: MotA/TolQ/ExbB proton channel family protein [Deltaproteobacteria bacterium]|nr:MotA/TolQ/ExbB proton channel family protein [Deltaproteobacteria bacterium]
MFSSTAAASGNGHLLQIFWGSDIVVKLTLLTLLSLSIASWAIISFKQKEFKKLTLTSARFLEAFMRAQNLEDLLGKYSSIESPLSNIFRSAAGDLLKKGTKKSSGLSIRRRVEREIHEQIERIERYIPFLATTGSSAPFIGLFGTVWGILAAFWQIGRAGSTSLAVVGPYIAEALIATAVGLAAAIPAVIFYNYFVGRIRLLTREIENFGEDLIDRLERDSLN